jgi:hypothetical protein
LLAVGFWFLLRVRVRVTFLLRSVTYTFETRGKLLQEKKAGQFYLQKTRVTRFSTHGQSCNRMRRARSRIMLHYYVPKNEFY